MSRHQILLISSFITATLVHLISSNLFLKKQCLGLPSPLPDHNLVLSLVLSWVADLALSHVLSHSSWLLLECQPTICPGPSPADSGQNGWGGKCGIISGCTFCHFISHWLTRKVVVTDKASNNVVALQMFSGVESFICQIHALQSPPLSKLGKFLVSSQSVKNWQWRSGNPPSTTWSWRRFARRKILNAWDHLLPIRLGGTQSLWV